MRCFFLVFLAIACTGAPPRPVVVHPPRVEPPRPTVAATAPQGPTEPGLLVAVLADQGHGPKSAAVLQHIRASGADLVIHPGDFDYGDDPAAWAAQIRANLSPGTPYLAAIGNHDIEAWPGYQEAIDAHNAEIPGLECSGTVGIAWACTYKGLTVLTGSPGLGRGGGRWFAGELAKDDNFWRICSWHYNQADMQVGGKKDQAGWQPFQACVAGGALIVNGHEHSYARTKTLTDPGNRAAGHGAIGPDAVGTIGPGKSVVVVSGLGGRSRREYRADLHDDDTWWAGIYAGGRHLSNGVEHTDTPYTDGVFYVRFSVDGDPRKAEGWFETVDGDVVDRVTLVNAHGPSGELP